MIVMGIETATEICGVAISNDEQIIAECRLNLHRAHSEKLVHLIKNICENINIPLEKIDLISISKGPGSFTGLRIGMASAKGLAFALKRPLVSVITLEALAFQGACQPGLICPIIKARVNEVYVALFEKKTNLEKPVLVKDYSVIPLEALKDFVPAGTLLIGNGVRFFQEQINNTFGNTVKLARDIDSQLSAAATALLGLRKFQESQKDEAQFLEPFYIQEFQVKRPGAKKLNSKF